MVTPTIFVSIVFLNPSRYLTRRVNSNNNSNNNNNNNNNVIMFVITWRMLENRNWRISNGTDAFSRAIDRDGIELMSKSSFTSVSGLGYSWDMHRLQRIGNKDDVDDNDDDTSHKKYAMATDGCGRHRRSYLSSNITSCSSKH